MTYPDLPPSIDKKGSGDWSMVGIFVAVVVIALLLGMK